MEPKRSLALLIAAIIGSINILIVVGSVIFLLIELKKGNGMAILSLVIGIVFLPYVCFLILATILNWKSYLSHQSALALRTGILYIVTLVTILGLSPSLIVSMILTFIGYRQLKEEEKKYDQESDVDCKKI